MGGKPEGLPNGITHQEHEHLLKSFDYMGGGVYSYNPAKAKRNKKIKKL